MSKLIGRKPIEVNTNAPKQNHIPIYDETTRLWGTQLVGSGSAALSGSNTYIGDQTISGSLVVTSGITGSLYGTASNAISASNANTASYALSGSGSFTGTLIGTFSGSLDNLQGTATHIPFFSASQVLGDSTLFQVDNGPGQGFSIAVNQNAVTTAAPEALYVYQPSTSSYNVISGKGNLNNYLQLNIQNVNQGANASSDVVATADNGNETINYVDMGINGENFVGDIGLPNDAYLYSTGRHLHIGNASNYPVQFFAGGSSTDDNRKLSLSPDNQHELTGSLNISGSLVVGNGITGSLLGNATSATTASFANNFNVASNITITGSAKIGSLLSNTHTVTGSLNVTGSIFVNGINVVTGDTGSMTVASASYATTASYVLNAVSSSYASNADLLDGKDSTIFATTGSNTFKGNQIITGSLSISGSTVQVGNNQLLGSTTLSGSVVISGNTTITGSLTALNVTASFGYVSASFLDITGKQVVKGYAQYLPTSDVVPISTVGGYIYSSGSQGDLYFSQTNGVSTNVIRLRWIEGNMYSGLLNGGVIGTASSTVYTVSSGSGIIVSLNGSLTTDPYPTIQYLNWDTLSASIAPLSASYDQTFVAISPTGSTGTIYAQGTPYNDGQFDTLIPLGVVLHQNHSTINNWRTQPNLAYGLSQRSSVFIKAFGPLKLSGFSLSPSGSSTGSLVVGNGTAYADGANYVYDPNNPSYVTDAGTQVSKIWRYYSSGSGWVYDTVGGAGYQTIDPTRYSLNGVLTAVPGTGANREWTNQRVYWFPNSVAKAIVVYYGNQTYVTEIEAIANAPAETFIEAPNTAANAIYLGYLTLRNNADFTDTTSYKIAPGGLFRQTGGSSGGGGATITQTLAGLSDVSIAGQTNGQPLVWNSAANRWVNQSTLIATLTGNASTATSASYAATASLLLGSVQSSSYATTASYSLSAVSSSYATTSSYISLSTINAGSVLFSDGTTITQDNSNFFWDDTNNRLGIGTTTPSEKLEINGNALIKTTYVGTIAAFGDNYSSFSHVSRNGTSDYSLLSDNAGITYLNAKSGNSINFRINNIDKVIIDSGGNLGVGTVTPGYNLDVVGTFHTTGVNTLDNLAGSGTRMVVADSVGAISTQAIPTTVTSASYATTSSYSSTSLSSSYALTASYALASPGSAPFPYTGTAVITGSLVVTTAIQIDGTLMDYGTVASSIVGSNNLLTQATGSYTSVFIKYTVSNTTNARSGEIMAVWNGSTVQYTDNSTLDIGSTTAVTSSISIVTSQLQYNIQTNTSGWKLKAMATFI